MSVGALWPKLILFSVPLALSNVLQIAFNMADLVVVGRYVGDEALAAVGSNVSLVSLLVCLIGGLTLGVGVLVSRFYGAKDDAALREAVAEGRARLACRIPRFFFWTRIEIGGIETRLDGGEVGEDEETAAKGAVKGEND